MWYSELREESKVTRDEGFTVTINYVNGWDICKPEFGPIIKTSVFISVRLMEFIHRFLL